MRHCMKLYYDSRKRLVINYFKLNIIMKKIQYLKPITDALVVRFEGGLLVGTNTDATLGADMNRGGGYGEGDGNFIDLD